MRASRRSQRRQSADARSPGRSACVWFARAAAAPVTAMRPALTPALSRAPARVAGATAVAAGVHAGSWCCSARALYLQGLHNDFLQQKGESRYARVLELPAHRGMITDRNGEPLAVSTPVESVWASPADAELEHRAARASSLDCSAWTSARSRRRLAERDREFVYLKRHLPPEHGGQGRAARSSGHFAQARVPPLLPGGGGDRASGRFHRRGRPRTGRHRARLPGLAVRQARQPARDQGPARPGRGGRESIRAPQSRAAISRCRSIASCSISPIAS